MRSVPLKPALRLGAFDAEGSWRPGDLTRLPAAPAGGQVEVMDELLAGLCAPGDTLVTRRPVAPELLASLAEAGLGFRHHVVADGPAGSVEELFARDPAAPDLLRGHDLRPYAVTSAVAALAAGSPTRLPAVADVVRVNSKVWSNELVVDLGLPGAGVVVRSTAELARAVGDVGGPAVVKDPYGVSGAGALDVGSPGVLRAIIRVLDRQVADGGRVELVVQPRYDKRYDVSGHGEVAEDGTWRWLGARRVRNRGFRYAGSDPLDEELRVHEPALREAVGEVARRARAQGYWGPLSVDGMVLGDGVLVPVLEVNARFSLGRLALDLDRVLGGVALWQVELAVPAGTGVGDLVRALRVDGLLYRGGPGAGCLVLGGGVMAAPVGRVHCALRCAPTDVDVFKKRVLSSFEGVGARVRGTVHAA